MKDFVLELAARQTGYNARLNVLREYVQAYILRIMFEAGAFRSTAFVGGTALRFLHALPRFSEDLDFSTVTGNKPEFAGLLKKIKDELMLAGYSVSVTYNDKKACNSAFIMFSDLMNEAGISPHKSHKLSVKIEIDTNPPEGAKTETRVVNKYFPVSFLAYELPSLFAGKCHALLNREYVKGRDYFDLGWYLSRWKGLEPNIDLLANSLEQTGWKGQMPTASTWRLMLKKTVEAADWNKVVVDMQSFLEKPTDVDIFTKEAILRLLSN